MKLILGVVFFFMTTQSWALGSTTDMEDILVTCQGRTFEGDVYKVMANYQVRKDLLNQEAPYSIYNTRRAFITIEIQRDGQVIYHEGLFTNDFIMRVTQDSTELEFAKLKIADANGAGELLTVRTDFLNVALRSERAGAFDFELKRSYGNFRNGHCD